MNKENTERSFSVVVWSFMIALLIFIIVKAIPGG